MDAATGTPGAPEVPVKIGGPSGTRTLDALIKSAPQDQPTGTQDDLSSGYSDDQD